MSPDSSGPALSRSRLTATTGTRMRRPIRMQGISPRATAFVGESSGDAKNDGRFFD